MKHLTLILCALLSLGAQAEVIATSPTIDKGEIRLTDEPCKRNPDALFMYIRTPGGKPHAGCWQLADGDVLVQFYDGDVYVYDANNFVVRKPARARRGEAL